jgi:hypothetical protein
LKHADVLGAGGGPMNVQQSSPIQSAAHRHAPLSALQRPLPQQLAWLEQSLAMLAHWPSTHWPHVPKQRAGFARQLAR